MDPSEFLGYDNQVYRLERGNVISYFRNNINFDQLNYGERIYQGENSCIIKASLKKKPDDFVGKLIPLRVGQNDEMLKMEIHFCEKLTRKLEAPKCFVEYFGHATETSLLKQVTYHLLFKYYPSNLRELIKKKLLNNNFDLIKSFFYQIIRGFAFLESCGIVHRDLKPENFMVDAKNEKVFIGDFGSAVKIKKISDKAHKFVGTEEYRSPEWFDCEMKGENESQINCIKSDCFVLGLVVLEMGGMPLTLIRSKNNEDFMTGVAKMIDGFVKIYDTEIKKNKENQVFFNDLEAILQQNPELRPSFLDVYMKTFRIDDELKLKYHIFIQDHDTHEIRMKPLKVK